MDSGTPVAGLLAGLMLAVPGAHATPKAPPAPAFTQTDASAWLNSAPLTWAGLRGTVTLLEFWTFDCRNCYRTIPWLLTLEPRYRARGFRIVSIHTPEFAHERVRANVEARLRELGVGYPVMLDNDFGYWNALGNKYWPAFYLVDRHGRLRSQFVGETHVREGNAVAMEAAIEALLAEP
ncbi:MAG: redoxin family protein [Gammaproteobacteria bacterium]